MASIYKRGPSWYLNFSDGQGQHRISLGKITDQEAKAALYAKEYELRTGHVLTAAPGKVPRFDTFAEDYLRWFEHEFPTSFKRVAGIVRNSLLPTFGALPLDAIRVKTVEDWKMRRAKEPSQRVKKGAAPTRVKADTVNKELRQLRAMLNKAVEWELIAKFPWPRKAVRQLRKEKAPPKFYAATDLNRLYVASGPKRWWWQLYVNTGMRKAEGLHLRWADIGHGSLQILSLDDQDDASKRTKSGEYRTVPLNDKASEALKQIKKQHGRLLTGDEHSTRPYAWDEDYVLPRVHINSLGRAFARDAARAGIGGSIHRLRHTFGTHLAMAGTPPKVIQELMGHGSMETTMGYLWSAKVNERAAVRSIAL
jgi:integrase